jgi:Uma2 family endonuclease
MVSSQLPEILTLENGDRLSGAEFERRYAAMPDIRKAELIEGVVHLPPAALRFRSHGQPHSHLTGWLSFYAALTPGVSTAIEPTTKLNPRNYPQPDVVLMIDSNRGGQAHLNKEDYLEGPPELAIEISASSVSIDLGVKKKIYCESGIKEYIVWRVFDRTLDYFYLKPGAEEYEVLCPNSEGVIQSPTFPGLWLATQALLAGNTAKMYAQLQAGLSTPEHRAFVAQLANNSSGV